MVDQLPDAADSLTLVLKLSGYEVQTAYTALESLELSKTYRPDVILLDLDAVNAVEVSRQIKHDPPAKKILVYGVTDYVDRFEQRNNDEVEFDRYLNKPVSLEQLQLILQQSLSTPLAQE